MKRRIEPAIIEQFLALVTAGSTEVQAARFCNLDLPDIRRLLAFDDRFRKKYARACEIRDDAIECAIRERALNGTVRPIFFKGIAVAKVREYDNVLLWKLYEAIKQEARERKSVKRVLKPKPKPAATDYSAMSLEELNALYRDKLNSD